MAAVPAALRKADIARFAQRAAQLEKAKPIIAYWCNYWIVEQILSKSLQNEDEESMTYSVNLMDKLESTKAELSYNDAVSDEMASQAYIEQFGLETFQRAENAMNANKASRQTADTFSAAAVFLELRQIWGSLDREATLKIRFAKYHALRIAKALKAGEDPNATNPVPEPAPSTEDEVLSPMDPDVQMLDGPPSTADGRLRPGQPFVEEIPDEDDRIQRYLARSSIIDQSLHPSRTSSTQRQQDVDNACQPPDAPSPQGPGEDFYHIPSADDVSPMVSPNTARVGPEGGGYFPTVPGQPARASAPSLPQVPQVPQDTSSPDAFLPQSPPATGVSQPFPTDSSLHSFPPPPIDAASALNEAPSPTQYHYQRLPKFLQQPQAPMQPPLRQDPAVVARIPTQPPPLRPAEDPAIYATDEDAILKAQKHARWAISALNFEDVKTAVTELRGALESLGVPQ